MLPALARLTHSLSFSFLSFFFVLSCCCFVREPFNFFSALFRVQVFAVAVATEQILRLRRLCWQPHLRHPLGSSLSLCLCFSAADRRPVVVVVVVAVVT